MDPPHLFLRSEELILKNKIVSSAHVFQGSEVALLLMLSYNNWWDLITNFRNMP